MRFFTLAIILFIPFNYLYSNNLEEKNKEVIPVANDHTPDTIQANAELLKQGSLQLRPYETFGKKNVTVKVVATSSGNNSRNDYQTSWGSYDKTNSQRKNLLVTVSSVSSTVASGLEFFWILTDLETKQSVYSPEKVVLMPDGVGKAEFKEETENTDLNLAAIGYRRKSGEKITGWMVRVVSLIDGRILGVAASSEQLKKLALSGSAIPLAPE